MAKIEKKKPLLGGRIGAITFGLLLSFLFPPMVALSQEERPVIKAPRKSMKDVYVLCAGCHKADGSGGPGYGGYAASFRKTMLDHDEIVVVITNGRRERGMPPFEAVLSDRVIDAMATYIETEFKGKP
jgi:cytochrome c553